MAHPRRPESGSVPIWMEISEADAAQIDQVLARPEFAGWGRDEWCLEIIRTALRYYARRGPAAEPGRERPRARPAAAAPDPRSPAAGTVRSAPEPKSPVREHRAAAREPVAATREPMTAAREPMAAEPEPVAAAPEPPAAEPECPHPADARDYETGTCAACGAVLWD